MARNNLYEQRKRFVRHKKLIKNASRIKKLTISLGLGGAMVAGFAVPAFASSINSNFPGNNGTSCNAWHGAPGGFGPSSPYYTVAGPQGGMGGQTFGQAQGVVTGQNNSGYSASCNS